MKKYILIILVLFFLPYNIFAQEKIDNGAYKVDIDIWHAYEDKESMSNASVKKQADLIVDNDKIRLFVEVKPITVSGITTSMSRIFFEEENTYKLANSYLYNIEIENYSQKRAEIFEIELFEIKDFYNIYIDPKVALMGKDPIKARLKVDYTNIKKASEKELDIFNRINNASNSFEKFAKAANFEVYSDGFIKNQVNITSFPKSVADKIGLKIDSLDAFVGYEVSFDDEKELGVKEKSLANQNFDFKFLGVNADEVYFLNAEEGNYKKVNFEKDVENIFIKNAEEGKYAFVVKKNKLEEIKKTDKSSNNEITVSNSSNDKGIVLLKKPSAKAEVKKINNEVDANQKSALAKKEADNKLKEKLDSNNIEKTNTENTENVTVSVKSQEKTVKKEKMDIVFGISSMYVLMLVSGLILLKSNFSKLLKEIERKKYISDYQQKEGKDA